jgi:dCMP deaminase
MSIANVVKERSTCLVRKCGAVLVKEKRIISTGYNGTPSGIAHCIDGACERCRKRTPQTAGVYEDKCICCHAEENVIVHAALHGVSTKGSSLYTSFTPCWWCAKMIINAGIKKVICGSIYPGNEATFKLLQDAGIDLIIFDKTVTITKPEEIWK